MENAGIRQIQAEQLLMNWNTSSGFLIYLLFCRGLPFYLLILLTLKAGGHLLFNLYFVYCGFSYGVQAVLLALRYQLAGIPICVLQIIPQIFFYFPALYLGYGLGDSKDGYREYNYEGKRRSAAVCFILWTIGILAEWYVNPLIIGAGMKFFL